MTISVETILQIITDNSTLVRRAWIGSKAGAHKGAGWGVWHLSQSVYQKVWIKSDPSHTEKKSGQNKPAAQSLGCFQIVISSHLIPSCQPASEHTARCASVTWLLKCQQRHPTLTLCMLTVSGVKMPPSSSGETKSERVLPFFTAARHFAPCVFWFW